MKKRLLTLLTSAVGILALSACGKNGVDDVINVSTFDINGQPQIFNDYFAQKSYVYNLAVEGSEKISLESFPASYKEKSLSFEAVDPSIASVDESGVITAHKKGYTDILIKSEDGEVDTKVRAVVSEKVGSSSDVASVISTIESNYSSIDYVAPSKFVRYEYSEEFYSCEGKEQYGSKSIEKMAYDANEGYFCVEGPYLTYKSEGGQPDISDGKWMFYSINDGLYVRMIHETSTIKSYFDLNTATYATNDEAIRAILNCFFVSGEKIINDALEDYGGKEDFDSFLSYSGTKFSSVDDSSLYINYDEANSGEVVGVDDEINYFNIPTGTVYSYTYHQEFLNSGNLVRTNITDMTMSYKLDGKNWTRRFLRNQIFDEDFEIVKVKNPKENGYKLVDSMYDL